jgi:hypothetical protein
MLRRLGSGKKTCLNGKYACFVRARTAARRAGDPGLEQMPLHILAATARMSGDLPAARVLAEEAIAMHESLGDGRMLAAEWHNLAHLELNAGDIARARGLFTTAREQLAKLGDDSMLPELALGIAALRTVDGEFARAARILGAVTRALETASRVLDPDDAAEQEAIRAELVKALGESGFEAEHRQGSSLGLAEALD